MRAYTRQPHRTSAFLNSTAKRGRVHYGGMVGARIQPDHAMARGELHAGTLWYPNVALHLQQQRPHPTMLK
jgi:hypothetical protein